MLNLVRKDILLQKNTLLIMLPLLIIYLLSGSSVTWVSIVFCVVVIMNAFAFDEKSSINLLLNSLPYTRKEIVSSKYISACVFTLLVLFTIFIGNLVIHKEILQREQILITISIVGIFISLAFPFSYFFKSQYLLIGFGVSFVIYMVIVNTFIVDLNDRIRDLIQIMLSFSNTQMYLLIIFSVMLLYIISWLFSIRIYSKKVF
ncbi:ABC-2 transporter permease [Lysinibacillus telephonicus]|uniref:ABC-2 transporter permease n=2 Tax=Lysinibacillus telephonicus TaxID=1714840 RepID=A0A3S0HGG2_9BACI|nr:ABC-2 transporter permease [Lysinibacillus telephonicus]RTQ91077.1 ABC-2 transporter permease [Lysinibacillus telephonicus]